MADPNSIQSNVSGVDPVNGQPEVWRKVFARHERDIGDIVNDNSRGPWKSVHAGNTYSGTFDAFEQIVTIAEQTSWRHTFSNGKVYDAGDVLIALGELLVKQGLL